MKKLLSVLALVASSTAAAAEGGYYWGLGLGYSKMDSDAQLGAPQPAETDTAVLGATLGYRFPTTGRMFYAFEGDVDLSAGEFEFADTPCSVAAAGPYYCTHTATLRLRGIAGIPLNKGWEVFGSAGIGLVFGTSATSTNTQDSASTAGLTYGIGVQGQMGRGTARFEVIQDNFTTTISNGGGYEPTYAATSVKASYLFSF